MQRRTFLKAAGAVGATPAIAGCLDALGSGPEPEPDIWWKYEPAGTSPGLSLEGPTAKNHFNVIVRNQGDGAAEDVVVTIGYVDSSGEIRFRATQRLGRVAPDQRYEFRLTIEAPLLQQARLGIPPPLVFRVKGDNFEDILHRG